MDALVTPSYPMITACAQILYSTGINAVEDAAAYFYPLRDGLRT
jgi:hypothetical protein